MVAHDAKNKARNKQIEEIKELESNLLKEVKQDLGKPKEALDRRLVGSKRRHLLDQLTDIIEE